VVLRDSSELSPTSWLWSISPSAGVTFVNGTSATSQHPQVQFANLGTYSVTLTATNALGANSATQANLITVSRGLPLAFSEDFSAATTSFPAGWRVVNPSSNFTWQMSPTPVMGPDNVQRRLPLADNFNDPVVGAEDYLITPPLNLSGSTSPELTFAVAHQQYSANENDGLRVDVSTDCGATFQPTTYLKRGAALATVTTFNNTSRFVPTLASQWRQETLDLRPYLPSTAPTQPRTLLVRFANLNDNGNSVYVTNVRVAERMASAAGTARHTAATLTASPVPFGGSLTVGINALAAGPATLQLLDAVGREVRHEAFALRAGAQQVQLNTENLPGGVYVLRLSGAAGSQQVKVVK
jgi:PKD repeat protein